MSRVFRGRFGLITDSIFRAKKTDFEISPKRQLKTEDMYVPENILNKYTICVIYNMTTIIIILVHGLEV